MRHIKLENIYENMLVPVGPMSVSVGPGPSPISADSEMTEEEEVVIAKKILKLTDKLDDIASEAHVKAYRRRIEDVADLIRKHAKKIVVGHPEV
jgi:hypothetical protein